jgi:hypothetical protein
MIHAGRSRRCRAMAPRYTAAANRKGVPALCAPAPIVRGIT